MKPSRPKKVGRKGNVKKRLDKVLWEQVKERDGGRCVLCGSTSNLGPHHIFSKKMHANLRWEPENLVTLCWFRCHFGKCHNDGKGYAEIEAKYPGKLARLQELDRTLPRLTEKDMRELYEKLAGSGNGR